MDLRSYSAVRASPGAGEVLAIPPLSIRRGYVFYIGSARRDEVTIDEALRAQTLAVIEKARQVALQDHPPPPITNWRKCRDCSLEPVCLHAKSWHSIQKRWEKAMAILYLTEQQSWVGREGDCLVVHIPERDENGSIKGRRERKKTIPLFKVEEVLLMGDITITTPALASLLEAKVQVTYLSKRGDYLGCLSPALTRNSLLRIAQH